MPSEETQAEAKIVKEVLNVAVKMESDELDNLLVKWSLWRATRIAAWVTRFITNCRSWEKIIGPLITEEIEAQVDRWIKKAQSRGERMEKFAEDKLQLNLQLNNNGICECRGRVQGDYPIYVPDGDILAEKLVAHMHLEMLHGGVSLTMIKIRQRYWIPRLRRLTKRVTRGCYGCKRFQVQAYADPPTASLPLERTTGSTPFKVIGVDFAGPI